MNNPIIYMFFKDVTNRRKNTKRVEVLAVDLSQYSEIHVPSMRPSNNLETKTPLDSY